MGLAKYGYIDLGLCWTVWLYSISFWTSSQDFRLVRLIQPTSHSDHILEICWIHWGWIHPDKLEHVISALVLVQWLMRVYCNRPSYSTNSYIYILFSTWTYSSAVFPLSVKGMFEAWYSSFDYHLPNPAIDLPSEKTSKLANLLAKTIGLWNNMSMTDVPNPIVLVYAATKLRVSNGSVTCWYCMGSLPSGCWVRRLWICWPKQPLKYPCRIKFILFRLLCSFDKISPSYWSLFPLR